MTRGHRVGGSWIRGRGRLGLPRFRGTGLKVLLGIGPSWRSVFVVWRGFRILFEVSKGSE